MQSERRMCGGTCELQVAFLKSEDNMLQITAQLIIVGLVNTNINVVHRL